MHLGFIGMSGVGKSYWAQQMADLGFETLHCDNMIAARLRQELGMPMDGVDDLGEWMGLPHEPGFAQREARYLAHEQDVMAEIVRSLAQQNGTGRRFVVDMTGSAIYTGAAVLASLQQQVQMVYFAISDQVQACMLREYVARPRPVIWQGLYQPESGEAVHAALARCYPALIAYRESHYQRLCHVRLAYPVHRRPGLSAQELLRIIVEQSHPPQGNKEEPT